MRESRAAAPRPSPAGADLGTLAELGRADLPAPPSPEPPVRPGRPRPVPGDGRPERANRIAGALAEAGVTPGRDDHAAVAALSGLDEETVATVTEWILRGRRDQQQGSPGGGRT